MVVEAEAEDEKAKAKMQATLMFYCETDKAIFLQKDEGMMFFINLVG